MTASLGRITMPAVPSLDVKLADWTRHRRRLELETRLLVVDDEPAQRKQIEDMLYRQRVSARAVETPEQAMELVASGGYPLVLVSESLSGLGGLYLLRQVRRAHPEVDALVSTWDLRLELMGAAFELGLLDVIRKPLPERQTFVDQVREAIRRNVDRRMQRFLLQQLRDNLETAPEEAHPAARLLEERLRTFKGALATFNSVLIVEQDDTELRQLSEALLVAGMHVETTFTGEQALAAVKTGHVHLLALQSEHGENDLRGLIGAMHAANPLLDVLLVSRNPDVERARAALLLAAAGYLPWPPASMPPLVQQVKTILRRSRRQRLLENLLVELYRGNSRAFGGPSGGEGLVRFCQLAGVERVVPEAAAPLLGSPTGEAVNYLDDVLDNILSPDETVVAEEPLDPLPDPGAERRVHRRVPERHFVRFRTESASSATLALVGDLSEGGLFVRTTQLQQVGTPLDLEFALAYQSRGYLVCCRGQVAWVARERRQSPLAPGFGVKFIDAPADVVMLLQRIVAAQLEPGA